MRHTHQLARRPGRPPFPGDRRGFNLIEVQVALLILLMTTVGLGRLLSQEALQVQWVESHQVADGVNSTNLGKTARGSVMTVVDQPIDVDGATPVWNNTKLVGVSKWKAQGLKADVDVLVPTGGGCGETIP